jgi:hypothetical protein
VKTAISCRNSSARRTNSRRNIVRGCSPRLLDSNPKALFLHYNVKCNKEDSDPAGHDVRVQFDVTKVDETQKAKDLDIQVNARAPRSCTGAHSGISTSATVCSALRVLQLQAPTERLDLRGNYVICKHLHAVFERILPSVQHNVVNILREREVDRKKDELDKTPERLKKKKRRCASGKRSNKFVRPRTKDQFRKLVDSLKEEEEARMLHEQDLEDQVPEAEASCSVQSQLPRFMRSLRQSVLR